MYQGKDGKGRVVISQATEEQVANMRNNPAYKFVYFTPIVEKVKVKAPAEVEDATKPTPIIKHDGGSDTNSSAGRTNKRRKAGGSTGSDRG